MGGYGNVTLRAPNLTVVSYSMSEFSVIAPGVDGVWGPGGIFSYFFLLLLLLLLLLFIFSSSFVECHAVALGQKCTVLVLEYGRAAYRHLTQIGYDTPPV